MPPSGDSTGAVQAAIYSKLSGDSTLETLLGGSGRVFDSVQESAQYPYVTIGDDTHGDWGSDTFDGREITATIHSWSQQMGRKEVQGIMKRIYDLLHNGSLTITGHQLVLMRFDFGEILKDPDARTHHGVQRFRLLTKGV